MLLEASSEKTWEVSGCRVWDYRSVFIKHGISPPPRLLYFLFFEMWQSSWGKERMWVPWINLSVPVSMWAPQPSLSHKILMNSWSQVLGWQVCQVLAQSRSPHHFCCPPSVLCSCRGSFSHHPASVWSCPWDSDGGHHKPGHYCVTWNVTVNTQPIFFPWPHCPGTTQRAHVYTHLFPYHLEVYLKSVPSATVHPQIPGCSDPSSLFPKQPHPQHFHVMILLPSSERKILLFGGKKIPEVRELYKDLFLKF